MVQMLKEKMLNKINSNPYEVQKVLSNMNKQGKTYMVVENGFHITGFRKTLKGAKSFAEKSLIQWYDDYTQDMTHNTNEVVEVSQEELTDYSSDVTAWYEFLLNNPDAVNYYTEAKYFFKVYVDDLNPSEEIRSYLEEQYDRMLQGKTPAAPVADAPEVVEEAAEAAEKEEEPSEEAAVEVEEEKEGAAEAKAETFTVVENHEKNGLEIYFQEKPSAATIQELKDHKFRWHRAKACWYSKATPEAKAFVEALHDEEIALEEPSLGYPVEVHLEPGAYTMKRTDSLNVSGGAIYNQITVVEAKVEPYAQYKKSLKLIYIGEGERKQRAVRFVSDSIEFYKGWSSDHPEEELQLVAIYANGYDGFIKF